MQLHFDEDLVEAVVLQLADKRSIAPLQIRRFRSERDRLYSIADPDDRNAAFFKVHLEWFREWDVEAALAAIIERFPPLQSALRILAFRRARAKHEEAGELYVNEFAERHGMIAVRPERFGEMGGLEAFLNHELQHLSDMVDPRFGYSPRVVGAPASPERLLRERYRLLWDVAIDGRLSLSGRPTIATREQRRAEFDRAHAFLAPEKRTEVFERLWAGSAATHGELMALASDPKGLREARRPEPGAACPLCRFPSFQWADTTTLPVNILAQIRSEFSDWQPDHGVCRRCVEIYEAKRFLENQLV